MKVCWRLLHLVSICWATTTLGCGGRQERHPGNTAGAVGSGGQSAAGGSGESAGRAGGSSGASGSSSGASGWNGWSAPSGHSAQRGSVGAATLSTGGAHALKIWKLGPSGRPRQPAAAFSEETLAVAAVAGFYEPRIVLNFWRGESFAELELEVAEQVGGPGIARSSDGFVVAWWSTNDPLGYPNGDVRIQHMDANGALLAPPLIVAEGVPQMRCSITDLGDSAAVLCGSSVLSVCTNTSCTARVLPDCQDAGDGRLVWDGKTLTLARVCRAEEVVEALRLSRFLPSGEPVLDEIEIEREEYVTNRPGLALDGDRILVAFAGWLHPLNARGAPLSAPVFLNAIEPGLKSSLPEWSVKSDLIISNGRLIASSCLASLGLDGGVSQSKLLLLDSALTVQGKLAPDTRGCPDVSMASSSSGRVVVTREVAGTIAIQQFDATASKLSPPEFFDGAMSAPDVLDVFCQEEKCRWAIGHRGVSLDEHDLPGRVSELLMDVDSSAAPVEVRGQNVCSTLGCNALFTGAGETVLFDRQQLSWINSDGSLAWTEPVPEGLDYWGPRGRASPYLAMSSNVSNIWRLHSGGTDKAEFPGSLYPSVICDAGVYRLSYGPDTVGFSPLFPLQPSPDLLLSESNSNVLCVADQIGMIVESRTGSLFKRLTLDGERLADVPLNGTVFVEGGEGDHALLVVSQGLDPSQPRTHFEIVRVPQQGAIDSRSIDLPQAGTISAVWFNGGQVHFAWHSARAVNLSSFPWL